MCECVYCARVATLCGDKICFQLIEMDANEMLFLSHLIIILTEIQCVNFSTQFYGIYVHVRARVCRKEAIICGMRLLHICLKAKMVICLLICGNDHARIGITTHP